MTFKAIEGSINWRVHVAERYDDFPGNERVGRIYTNLPEEIRAKIAVMFDYKGNLNVIWKEVVRNVEMEAVAKLWEKENEEIIDHYILLHVGGSGHDCGLWK